MSGVLDKAAKAAFLHYHQAAGRTSRRLRPEVNNMFAVRLEEAVFNLGLFALVAFLVYRYLWARRPAGTAFGSAAWMSDGLLRAWGLLSGQGLVIGRTLSGKLLTLSEYTMILLVGGTGSGKGVGYVIPALRTYFRGSVVAFDPKGDLHATTAEHRRRRGQTVVRLNPFDDGADGFNPLDLIPPDGPLVLDDARALAAALVVTEPGEKEPHWNQRATQVLTAILYFVLTRVVPDERHLGSVQDIASDATLLSAMADKLAAVGGIATRLGGQVRSLFESGGAYTKEGAGVLSTLTRHLAFLDSHAVGRCVSRTTFDPHAVRAPGVTLFLQIPPHLLEANHGLLRMWVSSFVRLIGSTASEVDGETLFLLDECSALGGLPALEEALVRGRSSGCRLLMAYQSDSQVRAAFAGKPSLIYDNCSTQIYLGASSLETAERISKMCGDYTQWVRSVSVGSSTSSSPAAGSTQHGHNRGTSASLQGRALAQPAEVLAWPGDRFVAFVGGLPGPILGTRVRWFEDPAFVPGTKPRRRRWACWWWVWAVATAVGLTALTVRAVVNGYWQKEVPRGEDRRDARPGDGAVGPGGVEERVQPVPGVGGGPGHGAVRPDHPRRAGRVAG